MPLAAPRSSERIAKVVRNRTRSNAQGLVKVLVPMPLTTGVDVALIQIIEVLNSHHAILKEPPAIPNAPAAS